MTEYNKYPVESVKPSQTVKVKPDKYVIPAEPAPNVAELITTATNALVAFTKLCEAAQSPALLENVREVTESVMRFSAVGNVVAALMVADDQATDPRNYDQNALKANRLVNAIYEKVKETINAGGISTPEDVGSDLPESAPVYVSHAKCGVEDCRPLICSDPATGLWCVRCAGCGVAGIESSDPAQASSLWNKHIDKVAAANGR